VPPANPLMRIEAVARDLEQLADELGGTVGPEARNALLHWHRELLDAVAALVRMQAPPGAGPGAGSSAT
jgi:hypothetical protein